MSELETQPNQRELVRLQFEGLLALPDEEYEEAARVFIDSRLQYFEANSDPADDEISDDTGNHKGFISDNVEVKPAVLGPGFRLDDPELYRDLPKLMKHYHNRFSEMVGDDPGRAYTSAILYAVQRAQAMYFSGGDPFAEESKMRRESLIAYSMDDTPEGSALPSIAEFKGVAQCVERAAVANNMLQVFGLEPVLVTGDLERSEGSEGHAYLVVKTDSGREVIYDPTNPFIRRDSSGTFLSTDLAIYPVEPTFLDQAGSTVSVEHKIYIQEADKEVYVDAETYRYRNWTKDSRVHPT